MDNDCVIKSVREILSNRFAATATLDMVELMEDGKYMVTEKGFLQSEWQSCNYVGAGSTKCFCTNRD